MNKTVVIGVGNPWRGDDAVGILAAREIKEQLGASASVIESDGEVTSLLECFKSFDRVYVIDAIVTGSRRPGHVLEIDALKDSLHEAALRASTHVLGVAQSIEMARALGYLPSVLRVFGIEAAQFEHGSPLSKDVQTASKTVAKQIVHQIEMANKEESRAHA